MTLGEKKEVYEHDYFLCGYCGGPEGVAVANVAYHLAAIIASFSNSHGFLGFGV